MAAGTDFIDEHVSIHFSPSPDAERNGCTPFRTIQDSIVEITETFAVRLTSSAPFVTITLNETLVRINDSDSTTVQFETSAYSVSEQEETLSVCVVLGAEIEREASVRVNTGDGTARSGPDFTQTDVELTFEARGSTRVCTSIGITNDDVVEDTEQFLVFLTAADEALQTPADTSPVSVTVVDNDRVRISLEREELSVEEEEGQVEMCVRLTGVIEKNVAVSLSPVPNTAHGETNSTFSQS